MYSMQQLAGCQCRYLPEAHIQCEEFAEVFCFYSLMTRG
jgi:hypothetical protein